jgi:hypothetical protein
VDEEGRGEREEEECSRSSSAIFVSFDERKLTVCKLATDTGINSVPLRLKFLAGCHVEVGPVPGTSLSIS